MHQEERTFLLPGDRTDNLEVMDDAELRVRNLDYSNEKMHFVCFAVNSVGSAIAR